MRSSSTSRGRKKVAKPLNFEKLEALAIHYVGRYATSRAKLTRYLDRKIYERGWDGDREPDIGSLVERLTRAGYIDDAAYASMRARDLSSRGYGKARLRQRLYADGIAEQDSEEAHAIAEKNRVGAAIAFASRRRLGPFAQSPLPDEKAREKALSAMVRAGHGFALSKRILALKPGDDLDVEKLSE